jgi:hypothetical protein
MLPRLESAMPTCGFARTFLFVPACFVLHAGAPAASGQVSIGGVSFIDRGWSGQIPLGDYGGGIGVLDYDRDGWQDLLIGAANGRQKGLFRNVPDASRPGARTFANVIVGSGLDDADNVSRYSAGILAADVDNDGDQDLMMTGFHFGDRTSGLLYRNDTVSGSAPVFTNVSAASGVRTGNDQPQSASFTDFDLDGDLDLLIASQQGSSRFLRFLLNNGDGTFADATTLVPTLSGVSTIYAHVWADFDLDGDQDCFVLSSGGGPSVLLNTFVGGTRRLVNVAQEVGFTTLGPAPMGIAAGDYDGDGDPDIAISNGAVGIYYRNDVGAGGARVLTRVTPFSTMWAWGVLWIDVDNDGDLDHYQCGSVGQGPNFDSLKRNLGGGVFDNISPAMNSSFSVSQFAVQVDWNNDGRPDVVSTNPFGDNRYVAVSENVSTTPNHWLKVAVAGDGVRVNRDGVGALVRVRVGGRTLTREVSNGSSTTSTEDLRQNFGLGGSTSADWVEVVWPRSGSISGRTVRYDRPIAGDQILFLTAPCAGDFNNNGTTDFFDYLDFVAAFGAGDLAADFTGDQQIDFFDYLDFVAVLEGC